MGRATWDGTGTNSIELFQESRFPHSLGLYYSAFTAWLGFEVNDGEYKVMGMAPYGSPNHLDKVRKVIDFADDGSFWLDMDYFSFHHSMEHTFSRKFEALFGEPRKKESDFYTHGTGVPGRRVDARHRGEPVLRRRRRQRPADDRRGDHQHRQLPAPADRLEAALHGRRRGVQQRRERPHPARDRLRGAVHPALGRRLRRRARRGALRLPRRCSASRASS